MAFLELHQSLRDHRKVLAVAAELDVCEAQVAGHCLYLWLWGLDNAEDGVLPCSERIIERAAGWQGVAGALVAALVSAGLLDRDGGGVLHIHDWWEYAGRLMERRQQNAARMREARNARAPRPAAATEARSPHVQRTFTARAGATVHNTTAPDDPSPLSAGEGDREGDVESIVVAAVPVVPAALSPVAAAGAADAGDNPSHSPRLRAVLAEDSEPVQLARSFAAGLRRVKPDVKLPRDLQPWAREFDLMLRVDHRPREKIEAVMAYAERSAFWQKVILSAGKLREKFDTLDLQREEDTDGRRDGKRGSHARSAAASSSSSSVGPGAARVSSYGGGREGGRDGRMAPAPGSAAYYADLERRGLMPGSAAAAAG